VWAWSWLWDGAGVGLLLVVVIVLTWPLWRTGSGVINFIDYNLPVSTEAAGAAFRSSLSPWEGAHGLGAPNVGFVGTTEFLGLFCGLALAMGVEIGSRLLLIGLVWLAALGAYVVLRASYRVGVPSACAGALFYILNPWVYDSISQGHLYTLEILAIAPFLVLAVPRLSRITTPAIVGIAVSIAIAVGSDYHLGLLILLLLGVEMIVLCVRGRARDALRLAVGVGAGLGLLSVYFLPYITSISAIQGSNNPGLSDLVYFSRFTSWHSAFSLLRPGMNAWTEVGAHGALFRLVWSLCCVAISLMAAVIVLRGGSTRLTGSPSLPLLALASVALANGASGLTKGAAFWSFSHIPLAAAFRDPSKFLVFPLFMCVPAVALLVAGEVPRLLTGDRESPTQAGRVRTDGIRARARQLRAPRMPGWPTWQVAGPALVIGLFLPLLGPGIRTISTVPTNSDTAVPTRGTRVAYLPSWQFVHYPGQPVPVNDPVQLYPRSPVAGLRPDYDSGEGNAFLRWLYSAFYFRRTDAFYNLARLAGVADVIQRSGVKAITGYSVTQQMFADKNLIPALRAQRPAFDITSQSLDRVTRHISSASIVSGSSSLLRVHGTSFGVLNDVADVANIGAPAICFEPKCPSGRDGFAIGALSDVPPGPDLPIHLRVQTAATYNGSGGGKWIDGRIAYGEAFGAVTEQLTDVAVGIGRSRGPVSFVGGEPLGAAELRLQVLRGPSPITYSFQCGETRLTVSPPSTVGGFLWTWMRFGVLDARARTGDCTIGMNGRLGAVAGGILTSPSPVRGETSADLPEVLFGPAAAAYSWTQAEASSFNYPGVTSTAAIVSDGGNLSFALPRVPSPRHIYASVLGIKGRVQVRARGAKLPAPHSVIARDQRAWIDLGEVASSERGIELMVTGGKVAIIRIAFAAPKDMATLNAIGSSAVALRLSGNIAIEGAGDVTVRSVTAVDQPTYLIVRSTADGLWSLDGREADGTYAGYGQIYRMRNDPSTLSSVLRRRAAVGALLSVLVAAALILASTAPWRRGRVRRSVR
jgi:hypothetical protein